MNFLRTVTLHDPEGKNVMLLGLDVLPEYRHQGLAREIMTHYASPRAGQEAANACTSPAWTSKVEMYKKMGYTDDGNSRFRLGRAKSGTI